MRRYAEDVGGAADDLPRAESRPLLPVVERRIEPAKQRVRCLKYGQGLVLVDNPVLHQAVQHR